MIPLRVRLSGRPWWQARYLDGKVVSEWDTIPNLILRNGSRSRWEELSRVGLRGLALICPDGQYAALEAKRDYALFQFKVGGFQLGRGNYCNAQVIGVVEGDNGECSCFAWEVAEKRLTGPFPDSVLNMRYRQVGPLGLANLQLR